jgi:hypothetical protein
LDVIEVSASFESQDSFNSHFGELFLFLVEELGRESGHGNVIEILFKLDLVFTVVHSESLELFDSYVSG